MIYEHLDQNPSEEFDYFLCEKLGWRSVDTMRRGMSALEWRTWALVFARRAQRKQLAAMSAGGGTEG